MRATGIIRKLQGRPFLGEKRVKTGKGFDRLGIDHFETHPPLGKIPFRLFTFQQRNDILMARVIRDPREGCFHLLFSAFEHLHESLVVVEEHSSDIALLIQRTAGPQQLDQFGLAERVGSHADINEEMNRVPCHRSELCPKIGAIQSGQCLPAQWRRADSGSALVLVIINPVAAGVSPAVGAARDPNENRTGGPISQPARLYDQTN